MAWQDERRLREEITEIHRRLYDLGFSVANDGNTSVRLDKNRILITPAGLNKAKLKPEQIAVVDADGKPISGNYPPSTEIAVHAGVYRARSDVHAIVHAHPPYCIACSLAGVSLDGYFLPEVVLTLGKIPTARYATTGTKEAGQVVVELIGSHDAVILDRHGTVTVGKSLEDALLKLERIEHTAKIVAIARSMGNVTPLPQSEIERLVRMGVTSHSYSPPAPPLPDVKSPPASYDPKLIDLITKEVTRALTGKVT